MMNSFITDWVLVFALTGGGMYKREIGDSTIEYSGCGSDGAQIAEYIRKEHRLHVEWMPKQPYLITDDLNSIGLFTEEKPHWWSSTTYCARWVK